jgi:hypothetical protein
MRVFKSWLLRMEIRELRRVGDETITAVKNRQSRVRARLACVGGAHRLLRLGHAHDCDFDAIMRGAQLNC